MPTVNLHASGESTGVPLVLLAPFPLDSRVWARCTAQLGRVRVIAVDPPGFAGASAGGEPSLEAYAGALLERLDAAGVDRFVVAGNSMGGYVALVLAEQHADRVAGIALIGTKSSADDDAARAKRLDSADEAESGTPIDKLTASMNEGLISPTTRAGDHQAVASLKQWLDEAPPAGFAWGQRAMAARPDRLQSLRTLDAPGLVLHGTDDSLMGPETQQPMAEALGVEVTTIADAGHLVPLEAPGAVAAALADLCRRAQGGI